eukprot:COSAG01_NODE_32_length_35644_cov_22.273738_16_plen_65_part_00
MLRVATTRQAHPVNLEFQGVAVSKSGGALLNNPPRAVDVNAASWRAQDRGATQPFVILQAAQLQ